MIHKQSYLYDTDIWHRGAELNRRDHCKWRSRFKFFVLVPFPARPDPKKCSLMWKNWTNSGFLYDFDENMLDIDGFAGYHNIACSLHNFQVTAIQLTSSYDSSELHARQPIHNNKKSLQTGLFSLYPGASAWMSRLDNGIRMKESRDPTAARCHSRPPARLPWEEGLLKGRMSSGQLAADPASGALIY